MIAERAPFHRLMPSRRILYVGRDLALLNFLGDALKDCQVVRCPGDPTARSLIGSEIVYSLLLLDGELPGTTGPELARLARRLPHRGRTPIIILSAGGAGRAGAGIFLEKPGDPESLARAVERLLAASR